MKQNNYTLGDVPRMISAACSLFLDRGNKTITCIVTGHRCYSSYLPQGGLEVPCTLKCDSKDSKLITKMKKLLHNSTKVDENDDDIDQHPSKKQKISDQYDYKEACVPWLSFHNIQLTVEDRDILGNGECLNDKHINFTQEILKQKFPNIYGFSSTLLLHKTELQSVPSCSSFLQIIHSRNCH